MLQKHAVAHCCFCALNVCLQHMHLYPCSMKMHKDSIDCAVNLLQLHASARCARWPSFPYYQGVEIWLWTLLTARDRALWRSHLLFGARRAGDDCTSQRANSTRPKFAKTNKQLAFMFLVKTISKLIGWKYCWEKLRGRSQILKKSEPIFLPQSPEPNNFDRPRGELWFRSMSESIVFLNKFRWGWLSMASCILLNVFKILYSQQMFWFRQIYLILSDFKKFLFKKVQLGEFY